MQKNNVHKRKRKPRGSDEARYNHKQTCSIFLDLGQDPFVRDLAGRMQGNLTPLKAKGLIIRLFAWDILTYQETGLALSYMGLEHV